MSTIENDRDPFAFARAEGDAELLELIQAFLDKYRECERYGSTEPDRHDKQKKQAWERDTTGFWMSSARFAINLPRLSRARCRASWPC